MAHDVSLNAHILFLKKNHKAVTRLMEISKFHFLLANISRLSSMQIYSHGEPREAGDREMPTLPSIKNS